MHLIKSMRKKKFINTLKQPKKYGFMELSNSVIEKIINELQELGYPIRPFKIDIDDYRNYFLNSEYTYRYPNYYATNLPEKTLEHYIAAKLLDLTKDDIYIDIASEGSPVPEIYHRLFGVTTYRQDLVYPPGLNGSTIGGDAGAMPISDGFASKMGLHCSFEHFEGDADIRFILEAKRVLIPGGKICIVPLYIHDEYSIITDPEITYNQKNYFDQDATIRFVEGWGNRFGRFYDPKHLVTRILNKFIDTKVTVYHISNSISVDPSCYALFALMVDI